MSVPPVSCSWAPWWTPEQLGSFVSHVESVVRGRFGEFSIDVADGTVTVAKMDCVLGLSNLAQTCRAADPADWRLIIYSHIARLDDFTPDALAERLGDFERLQPDLRLRVVGAQHLCQIDAVRDPLPLGLYACLSVDLDGAACPVDRSYFDKWGVERGAVMGAALSNTLMAEPLVALGFDGGGGAGAPGADGSGDGDPPGLNPPRNVRVFVGESLFATGHLLDFAHTVPDIGSLGAVVTVPAAHTVMVCPVELNQQFMEDSAHMLAASYLRFLAGPNSVSPNALWWRPDHPLAGFATLDNHSFELVVPEPLRSHLRHTRHQPHPEP